MPPMQKRVQQNRVLTNQTAYRLRATTIHGEPVVFSLEDIIGADSEVGQSFDGAESYTVLYLLDGRVLPVRKGSIKDL